MGQRGQHARRSLRGPQNCCGTASTTAPRSKCYTLPAKSARRSAAGRHRVRRRLGAGWRKRRRTPIHLDAAQQGDRKGHWTPDRTSRAAKMPGIASSALLPNGNVLVEGSTGRLYEFDGKNLTHEPFSGAGGALMVLPTGEILVGGSAVYQSTGTYQCSLGADDQRPSTVTRGAELSDLRHPVQRLEPGAMRSATSTRRKRTIRWCASPTTRPAMCSMPARTITARWAWRPERPVSTNFDVPAGTETGASTLEVVANGIPSKPVSITVN